MPLFRVTKKLATALKLRPPKDVVDHGNPEHERSSRSQRSAPLPRFRGAVMMKYADYHDLFFAFLEEHPIWEPRE